MLTGETTGRGNLHKYTFFLMTLRLTNIASPVTQVNIMGVIDSRE